MAYIQNYKFGIGDSPSADSFGRLRVSNPVQIWDGKSPICENADIWANYATGPGSSVSWDSSTGLWGLTAGPTGHAIHRSRYSLYYQSGKSPQIFMTFDNFGGTGSVKRVGYYSNYFGSGTYDVLDGLVLENNDGNIAFNIYRRSSTPTETFPISGWSNEYFEPNDIDWDAPQIMEIDFEWLSVGRVRFGLVIDGLTRWFVYSNHANDPQFSLPYMISPNNFLTYEIVGAGATSSMKAICSSCSIEGSSNSALGRNFAIMNINGTGTLTKGTRYATLGYRVKAMEFSLTGLVDIQDINAAADSSVVYAISAVVNPTITGGTPTWVDVPGGDIPIQYSSPATTLTATGGYEYFIGIGSGSGAFATSGSDNLYHPGFTFDDTQLHGVKADEVWFCITPLSGNITSTNKVYVSANLFLEAH